MRRPAIAPVVAAICLLAAVTLEAYQLKPATLRAFEKYTQITEARMATELDGRAPFLWIDRQPPKVRADYMARLQKGEIISERLETLDKGKSIDVDDGLIHHWIGTVLIPKVTLDKTIAFVQDYAHYPDAFAPTIQRAKVISRTGDHFDVTMRTWAKNYGVTVVLDADYGVTYRRLSPTRLASTSIATNVFQVDGAGTPGELRTPGDQARGFLWRLNTYCWFDERPEGTYEQCESISLTADAPFIVAAIVRALTNRIPRDTLEFTLGRVRNLLCCRGEASEASPSARIDRDFRGILGPAGLYRKPELSASHARRGNNGFD